MRAYILYADETNAEPAEGIEFFIYGGVWLPVDNLPSLHTRMEDIRAEHDFRLPDQFKFDTRSRPPHVTAAQHRDAKRAVLDACGALDVRFSAAVVLHQIASEPGRRWRMQAGALLLAFRDFLEGRGDSGIVVMDRGEQVFDYLRTTFQRGVRYETGRYPPARVRGVHLFAAGAIGTSHLASVSDIVLGSFRFCVNDTHATEATRAMLPVVVSLMWKVRQGNSVYLADKGLLLRPRLRSITVPEHRERYEALISRLSDAAGGA